MVIGSRRLMRYRYQPEPPWAAGIRLRRLLATRLECFYGMRHAGAISRVCLAAVLDVKCDDFLARTVDRPRRVVEQGLLLRGSHQPIQRSRLRIIILIHA